MLLDLTHFQTLLLQVIANFIYGLEEARVFVWRLSQAVLLPRAHLLRIIPHFEVAFHVLCVAAKLVHLLTNIIHFLC